MAFSVGDKVVHPGIGAGKIVGTKDQEMVDGFERYYVVEIPGRDSVVYIPVRTADELGVRAVVSPAGYEDVLEVLAGEPNPLPDSYKRRQDQVEKKIKTGRVMSIAEMVRDLTWRKETSRLTKRDSDLLARARKMLSGELALAAEAGVDEINRVIDAALETAVSGNGDGTGM